MRDLGEADFAVLHEIALDMDMALFDKIQEERRRAMDGLEPIPPDGGSRVASSPYEPIDSVLERRSRGLTYSTQPPKEGEK